MQDEIILINKVLGNKDYYAEGKINEGSYGQIFKVVHLQTRNVYAMKALQLTKLQKLQKMHEVLIQMCILQKLTHPGIIHFHNKLQRPNYIGLLLEFCPYGDLFTLMRSINKNIELTNRKREITVYYLAQIIDALDYMHSRGIIHRDIKPENIVLGEDHKVRIIDFGTGRIISDNFLTQKEKKQINDVREAEGVSDETLVGSLNYLSPEVLKLQYTQKCDIWAFGVIAYKFCYNHLPFEGKDKIQIFRKIVEDDIEYTGKIDPEIQELLEMSLKKNPAQRATSKMLKKCSFFKDIDFDKIFEMQAPLCHLQMKRASSVTEPGGYLLEVTLQKRMFFGNYKPRLLTMAQSEGRLFMSYRYIPSRKIRNQFEINLNDYAQVSPKNNEFQVVTGDKKYCFRPIKGEKAQNLVHQINEIIKKYYKLD